MQLWAKFRVKVVVGGIRASKAGESGKAGERELNVDKNNRLGWVFRVVAGLAVVVWAVTPLAAQRGFLTVPRNLNELVLQSATIVEGRIVRSRVEPHPEFRNLPTLVITVRVDEVLKGAAGPTLSFRQFIPDIRDQRDGAGYVKGHRVLLLINPASRYGLTSTAGVQQGRFRILRDTDGREFAVNGHGNSGLFARMDAQLKKRGLALQPELSRLTTEHRSGPVALDDLRTLIRTLAGGR